MSILTPEKAKEPVDQNTALRPLSDENILLLAATVSVNLDEARLQRTTDGLHCGARGGQPGLDFIALRKRLAPGCLLTDAGVRKLERLAQQDDVVGMAAQDFLRAAEEVKGELQYMGQIGQSYASVFARFTSAAKVYRTAALALGLAITGTQQRA